MKEYEVAQTNRRIGSYIIDFFIVFIMWYMMTKGDLESVDSLLETLDPMTSGSATIFQEAVIKLYVLFIFKMFFASCLYNTIAPAIIGKGKTVGKLVFGLSMKSEENLKEISPTRLIYREIVLKSLLEYLLVLPCIISFFMMIKSEKSQSLHDKLAKTVVLKDSTFVYMEDEYE